MGRSAAALAAMVVVLTVGLPPAGRADVLISELCDPRLNYQTDRFVEIANSGDEAVDLTGWRLVAVANGVDVFTWTLDGLIDSRQALVAGDATTVDVFPVAFADEAWSGSTGNWNGKTGDGARLEDPFGAVVDRFVAAGTVFENADYVRNPGIVAANPVPTPSEWTATPVNLASDASPGVHDFSPAADGPAITGVRTDPAAPGAADPVHVLAEIADEAASITGAAAVWGTDPTSLPNEIAMALVSGSTYRTVAPIPPQGGGVTVHFRVEAVNNVPASSASGLFRYAVPVAAAVSEIQGGAATSPYLGSVVTTAGIVTAVFGTEFVLQDGTGPRCGLWVRGTEAPAPGDSVSVTGRVTEDGAPDLAGTTMLVDAEVVATFPARDLPAPVPVSTAAAAEDHEGVLVEVDAAVCTRTGDGEWEVDDGSGAIGVGGRGVAGAMTLGTTYRIRGPVAEGAGGFRIEPRGEGDLVWVADHTPPMILSVSARNDTALRVTFSEPVEAAGASERGHYTVPGLTVESASPDPGAGDVVWLAVSPMATGDYTLSVSGVPDRFGNAIAVSAAPFSYTDPGIPAGYYDGTDGLAGEDLEAALHAIIGDHTVAGYDYAWTAYRTTDVRPDDGKVWDIYSDVPGGSPAYLYTFGSDEGGVGGTEGTGYTREHTWCKSWFGGEVSPMYSDLFALYPCDTHMNGTRGVFPYGETAAPQFVSTNGSEVGPSSVPGYTGTVFEPIDAFKGDLARVYFYFSIRYRGEDAGWPGGPATDGAELKPWARDLFRQWNAEDPVSRKEIDRNNAVHAIQGNRNPFVDRPEFVDLVYGQPTSVVLQAAALRSSDGTVRVNWRVADPGDRALYDVYREGEPAERARISPASLTGRTDYAFVDENAPPEAAVYWVGSRERDGTSSFHGPIPVAAWSAAAAGRLLQGAAPNPFAASTTVDYRLAAAGRLRIDVFDCAGRRIRRLADGIRAAGAGSVAWDGRDDAGVPVAGGVYFVRVHAGDRAESARLVRVSR